MRLIKSENGVLYSDIEKTVYDNLKKLLTKFPSLSAEAYWERQKPVKGYNHIYIPDILLKKDGKIVSVLDIKSESSFKRTSNYSSWLNIHYSGLPIEYQKSSFAITDGNTVLFKFNNRVITTTLLIYLKIVSGNGSVLLYRQHESNSYLNQMQKMIEERLGERHELSKWLQKQNNNIFQENEYSVKFGSDELENQFFLNLLGKVNEDKICRYTTLNSLFFLLKKNKQNMCSIVCMNDKGEKNYVNERLLLKNTNVPDNPNDCYIISLLSSKHEDELTFWRLYGNDAAGVCITYNIREQLKEGKNGSFYIARVSYEKKDKTHPELDLISDLSTIGFKNKKIFTFNNWHIWKHFFKSNHFSVEEEVRLLFIPSSEDKLEYEWIKNDTNMIVSKMLLFDLNDKATNGVVFPLTINQIRIGPKITDGDVIDQYDYMAKCNLNGVSKVCPSEINDIYR